MRSVAICGDCLSAMKSMEDNAFDLALVDGAYGRGEHGGKSRSKLVLQKNGTRLYVGDAGYERKSWDTTPVTTEYFDEIIRVSRHQIIWGCNYYPIAFGTGRIIWDKCNDGSDQSDCEIAYNSMTDRVDVFRFMWRGMMQGKSISEGTIQQGNKSLNEKRIHPCQKPVALYTWLLQKYASPGWKILDPFLGSGSSRIAAYDLGFDFTGYEIDKDYYLAQEERFLEHTSQMSMFVG